MTKRKGSAAKSKIAWGNTLLVLLVATWMFLLGVMVGRGTAPVHFDIMALQKELDQLRQAAVKKERDAVEKAIRGEDPRAALEFYEKLKRDGLDTSVNVPSPGESVSGLISSAQAKGEVSIPHKKRAPILKKKRKREATEKRKVSPPQKTATSPERTLTIQIASLKDGGEAGRIVANLKKEGYPAYLSRVVIPQKGLWFRVRVGNYADEKQAAEDMAKLTKAQKKPILLAK